MPRAPSAAAARPAAAAPAAAVAACARQGTAATRAAARRAAAAVAARAAAARSRSRSRRPSAPPARPAAAPARTRRRRRRRRRARGRRRRRVRRAATRRAASSPSSSPCTASTADCRAAGEAVRPRAVGAVGVAPALDAPAARRHAQRRQHRRRQQKIAAAHGGRAVGVGGARRAVRPLVERRVGQPDRRGVVARAVPQPARCVRGGVGGGGCVVARVAPSNSTVPPRAGRPTRGASSAVIRVVRRITAQDATNAVERADGELASRSAA